VTIANKRRKMELLDSLYINQLASRGKKEDLKKAVKELQSGR